MRSQSNNMQCHHYEEVVVGSCFFEKNKQTNKQTKTKPKKNQSTWNDFFNGKKCFTTITREIE